MDLSHSQMRAALGVSATSLEVWLRHSLRQRAGRGRGNDPYVYELSDVVAALRLHRRKKLSPCDLVALCAYLDDKPPDAPLFDPDARASALIDVLTPEELQRFERAKRWLGQSDTNTGGSQSRDPDADDRTSGFSHRGDVPETDRGTVLERRWRPVDGSHAI